jgi:hypothetical protein
MNRIVLYGRYYSPSVADIYLNYKLCKIRHFRNNLVFCNEDEFNIIETAAYTRIVRPYTLISLFAQKKRLHLK